MMVRERVLTGALAATLAAGLLSGCGVDDPEPGASSPSGVPTAASPPPSPSPSSSPSPAPAAEVTLFEFEITDGRAEPPLQRATVESGGSVRIVVSSDQPDELHLHGYDLEAEMAPGDPAVIEFVADRTGQFELETHDSHVVLLQLLVR